MAVHLYALAFKKREVEQLVTEVEAALAKKKSSVPLSESPFRAITVVAIQSMQPVQKRQESPIVAGITPEELKQQA